MRNAHPAALRPAATGRRPSNPGAPTDDAPTKRDPWGWLEIIILTQYAAPALIYIPSISLGPLRGLARAIPYAIPALGWMAIELRGRPAVGRPSPARPWALFCCAWMALSIFHPQTNSLMSGIASAAMQITVLAPIFWVPKAGVTTRRLGRLLILIFLCNGASALLGLAQFYQPDRFMPVLPEWAMKNDLTFTSADGRQIRRPIGLGVFPGAAAWGGALAVTIGTALTLRKGPWWWRIACPAISIVGMAIIYFGQVRTAIAMAILSLSTMPLLFLLQRDIRRAVGLMACGATIFAVGLVWVMRTGGDEAIKRFDSSFREAIENPADFYYNARGYQTDNTLEIMLDYPMGCGMGRWGQPYEYFGDKTQVPGITKRGQLFVEIQINAWVIDGGLPLTVAYIGAIAAAFWAALQTIRTTPDRDVGFWGVVIVAASLSIVAGVLSHAPFILDRGILFWVMLTALHTADQQARIDRRKRAAREMARAAAAFPAPPR